MKFTLKNIKFSEFASHDSNCFQATVYIDGKRSGVVNNDGWGGCNNYQWNSKDIEDKVRTWELAQPKLPSKYNDDGLDFDLDFLIHDLFCSDGDRKQRQKWAKSGRVTVYRLDGDEKGSYRTIEGSVEHHLPRIRAKHEGATVFNKRGELIEA